VNGTQLAYVLNYYKFAGMGARKMGIRGLGQSPQKLTTCFENNA